MLTHAKLAAWYYQLAQHLEAGLPLAQALRASAGHAAPVDGLEAMAARIEAGGGVDDALQAAREWLPRADRRFLSAAARAGAMPRTLRSLSTRHAALGSAKLRLAMACGYPLIVLHVGLLVLPILSMIDWERGFQWNLATYGIRVAALVFPLWTAIGLAWHLARRHHPAIYRLARLIPFAGGYVRAQGLSDLSFALSLALEAGVPVGEAWKMAGGTARAPELRQAAASLAATVERGEPPGDRLRDWPCFPPDFVALYRTGETTGQLDRNLLHLANAYQENAGRSLKTATVVYPVLLYLAVAAAVAFLALRFYIGYFGRFAGM